MTPEFNKVVEDAVKSGIIDGIKSKFSAGYNSPLEKILQTAMETHAAKVRALLEDAIEKSVNDPDFRDQVVASTRAVLAKTLVQRFGGEIEKQVNALKSDPVTRARITLALEDIVKSKT